jgi:hypothetical protein
MQWKTMEVFTVYENDNALRFLHINKQCTQAVQIVPAVLLLLLKT